MDEQVRNYKETVQNLNLLLQNGTGEFLRRSLFFICIGANDYINNYLLPFSDKSKTHTPSAYAQLLVQEYTRQIMVLCFNIHLSHKNYEVKHRSNYRYFLEWVIKFSRH